MKSAGFKSELHIHETADWDTAYENWKYLKLLPQTLLLGFMYTVCCGFINMSSGARVVFFYPYLHSAKYKTI